MTSIKAPGAQRPLHAADSNIDVNIVVYDRLSIFFSADRQPAEFESYLTEVENYSEWIDQVRHRTLEAVALRNSHSRKLGSRRD